MNDELGRDDNDFQMKLKFLAYISHEIRNPIGVILGYAAMALDSLDDHETTQLCLLTIQRNGKHLMKLADEFLDFSKASKPTFEPEKEETSLLDIFRDLFEMFRVESENKALHFHIYSETLIPQKIITDPVRFRQVLANLLGNAIKFTESGIIEIKLRYEDGEDQGKILEFDIRDTGIGISEDHQVRIFKDYAQSDASICRKYGGTGLGLPLSCKLAKALNGHLKLKESCPGKGSTFSFLLKDVQCPDSVELVKFEMERFSDKSCSDNPIH